jgi:SAM-dependent methyltransferase
LYKTKEGNILLKRIIKNLLPYCIVNQYQKYHQRKVGENFIRIFQAKASLLSDNRFSCLWEDRYPCLSDDTENLTFDAHYTYHTAWAARLLAKTKPAKHIDISSSFSFMLLVSAFIPFEFYEYRQVELNLPNLKCGTADLCSLPFKDESVESISCMHVVEHIGLERYGDAFDPQGDLKAISELQRVLKPSGNLFFVVPLGGAMRIQYNAHRIYTCESIREYFKKLEIMQFSLVTDDGRFLINANAEDAKNQKYGCGCFWFRKR